MMNKSELTSEFLSSLLESIAERIVVVDPKDYKILYANRSFQLSYGEPLETLLGKHCYEVTHRKHQPCHIDESECPVKDSFETGNPSTVIHIHADADGRREYVRLSAYPIRNPDGKITGVVEASTDITVEINLQEELRRKSELFEKILITSPDGIIGNDRKGNIFLFNSGAEKIFGYSRDEVIGKIHVSEIYPPGRAREVKEILYSEHFGSPGEIQDFETEVVGKDGSRIPIRLSATLLYDQGGEIGTIGFFHDISDKKALKGLLQESEESYRGIFESAKDAILTIGEDRFILKANRAAEEVLGYGTEELTGKNVCEIFPADYMEHWDNIRTLAPKNEGETGSNHVELFATKKSGEKVPVHVSLSENRTSKKTIITIIFRDISERIAFEEELRVLSITDALTKLYNRRHFHSLAEKEIVRSSRTGVPFSILLLDLDRFKGYNDAYGHVEGDKLLVAVADLIRETFRSMDTGFRFGGEEFVILLPDTDSLGAMIAAERFRIRLSEILFTPAPGGKPVTATASVGISEFRKGYTLDKLVCYADLAMYAAKNGGRNRSVSYEQLIAQNMKPPSTE
ncbi:MAG: PAS domain S-box protein [Deltaproteobacteria bacterium]|nr:PAS domain S-box protein [Deltaproteobacteria bacterium]